MEAQDNTKKCMICGEEITDGIFCYSCMRKNFINPYHYKPRPKFFGHAGMNGSRRAFGVEIEVIAKRNDDIRRNPDQTISYNAVSHETKLAQALTEKAFGDFAYLKSDGSLPMNGFEIVTHPATFRYLKSNRVFDVLRDLPVASFKHECTGIHIHVSRAKLSELQLCKLVYFYSKPENAEYLVRVAQRDWRSNSYCRPMQKGKMKYYAKATEANGMANHYERYHALNLTNEATVEFRMFKGNVKPEAIYRAIQFVDAMIEFTAHSPATKLGHEDFIAFVEKNHNRFNLLASWNVNWKTAKLYNEVGSERRNA